MLLRLASLAATNTFALLRLLPMSGRDKDIKILALSLPLVIDGFIGVGALPILRTAPLCSRLYVWTLVGLTTLTSIWANGLHAVRLSQQTRPDGLHLDDFTVGGRTTSRTASNTRAGRAERAKRRRKYDSSDESNAVSYRPSPHAAFHRRSHRSS